MKVNVDAPILDINGDVVPELTAKKIMVDAMMIPLEEDTRLSGDQKIKHFLIAQRLHAGGDVELTSEDITMIKSRVAKAFNTLATGRIWELLDPASLK